MTNRKYKAIVSSDWSECLSPNGPFDPISFIHPHLESPLRLIFKKYTGNVISLDQAVKEIKALLPDLLSQEEMDAYMASSFATYKAVPELIEWCLQRDILFMINTTGTQGYFQRALAKKLLPSVPAVAANPMIRYDYELDLYDVREIDDKPKNTEAVIRNYSIPRNKLVVMGDSGGDGPHFQWAAQSGGFLIGNMTKASLAKYCKSRGVRIDNLFGLSYAEGQIRDPEAEMDVNYMELTDIITEALNLQKDQWP